MNLTEKQSTYILTILNEGSISAAARALYISQPSLSQTVKQVEAELGAPIFDRSTDPISLTPHGECYVDAARRLLSIVQTLQNSVDELNTEAGGTIRFGIPVQRGLSLLPEIIPRFHALYPDVELKLIERGSGTLHELAAAGSIDLAVLTTKPEREELEYILLKHEDIVLLCDRRTKLAQRIPEGTPISIAEAKDELFVSNLEGHNVNFIQNELFQAAGIHPHILCASSNISVGQQITVHSGAVMLCPDSYIEPGSELSRRGAVYPLLGAPHRRSCYLCYRKDLYQSKFIKGLIDVITSLRRQNAEQPQVSVADMMAARDQRAAIQKEMLSTYNAPLISLTLNIPGANKVFDGVSYTFERGLELVQKTLEEQHINVIRSRILREATGFEAFFAVSATADFVKELMCRLEEAPRIGRLLDIDVLDSSGKKLNRLGTGRSARCCLLCGKPAFLCSRSRSHSTTELLHHIHRLICMDFLENCCKNALLGELYTTPKPGLVDLHDQGAHSDMDVHTFEQSTAAILPYLVSMAEAGYDFAGTYAREAQEPAPSLLFQTIRKIGKEAEAAMFEATGGVNTHKGMIFSMGILMAASAYCRHRYHAFQADRIFLFAKDMTQATIQQDFAGIDKKHPKTHGESLFVRFGYRGVRGEAADGFPSVRYLSLPAYQLAKRRAGDENLAKLEALLVLMAKTYDTTVLYRTDHDSLIHLQTEAEQLLRKLRSGIQPSELHHLLYLMNQDFITRNLSPGGCADLLAATIFMDALEAFR